MKGPHTVGRNRVCVYEAETKWKTKQSRREGSCTVEREREGESGEKTRKMEELVRGRIETERERERQGKSNADQSVRIRVVRQRGKAAEEAGGAKVVFEASRRMAGCLAEGGNRRWKPPPARQC